MCSKSQTFLSFQSKSIPGPPVKIDYSVENKKKNENDGVILWETSEDACGTFDI